MGRNLEDQMRLSMRGILSKQMITGGEKNRVVASFVSDDNGFPLTGMKKSGDSIIDMEVNEFEQISALIPQIWGTTANSTQDLELLSLKSSKINHITVGFKGEKDETPNFELLIARLDELYISSLFKSKK
ncbi:hypothetical protein CEE45_05135 [Candidatus Heimdallarchaeota archaeon B3_Heim]|nr:MAG: hypothetical protein CEE45_05135 [Candidatus Heimdallarchaeota archaeon B3_Heim]